MGLDCFIRKISKSKVLETYVSSRFVSKFKSQFGDEYEISPSTLIKVPVAQPLNLVPTYWNVNNEISYWRGWRKLNSWMMELAREKSSHPAMLSGAPVLLTEEDIERLRFEVLFGDIWNLYMDDYVINEEEIEFRTQKLHADLDRIKRILRRNASLVFYVGSW